MRMRWTPFAMLVAAGILAAVPLHAGNRPDLENSGVENSGRARPGTGIDKPAIIVIFTDDQGFADLGVQGVVDDVRTPHLDVLAKGGVRMTNGYVTAPQCVPSRAGLLTGRYQQRFGLEMNTQGPLPLEELTIAERLKGAGYVTGMVGKWHLNGTPRQPPGGPSVGPGSTLPPEPSSERKSPDRRRRRARMADPRFLPAHQGFDEYFCGARRRYVASHDLDGKPLQGAARTVTDTRFRIDVQTDAAISFLRRHARERFLLYLAYFAPHVPLEATPRYLERFPDTKEKERKLALAMISAVDDGVGRIVSALRELDIENKTLVFFISDNGAPLKKGAWDGSLNLPLVGEKGMLTDGGIRVPFVVSWKGVLPSGKVYDPPVSSLDVAATAATAAGLPLDDRLDGVDLVPYLRGEKNGSPHPALYWRWRSQAAIRKGRWKLVKLARERTFLFDLDSASGEKRDVLAKHSEIAASLEKDLKTWSSGMMWPHLPEVTHRQDAYFFDAHVRDAERFR